MNESYVVISIPGTCRARVYPEGGIGYDTWTPGIGWTEDNDPDSVFEQLALHTRRFCFPHLSELETGAA